MKENMDIIETKLRNLTFIVILGFVILGLLVIGLYFTKNESSKSSTTPTTTDVNYDVSKMNQISGSDAAKLFDEKGTHILYIGRSTCSVCVKLVPELNEVINSIDVKINYSPLESTFRSDFEDLFDKLSIETTVNENEGTFGELLKEYGYTPVVVIIKDGKMVDGFVGYRDADTIKTLFEKYL